MGNTPNALYPRCNESEESHPHFIFHCKLSQTTLTFINRLINRNYKFQSPYKINITDVLMASFDRTHEDIKLEIFPILIEVFIRHLSFCRRKAFYEDGYDKINELDNYKGNLISKFKNLKDKTAELGSKQSFLKKWKPLLDQNELLTIQFNLTTTFLLTLPTPLYFS